MAAAAFLIVTRTSGNATSKHPPTATKDGLIPLTVNEIGAYSPRSS